MHAHLIGVCGTGMASLAGLLRQQGHEVTGSDSAFFPPMADALARWDVRTYEGFDASHLDPRPDWVVIGNVCRPDNPEARAAIDRGIPYLSLAGALAKWCLQGRRSLVVAGTHGKTTTASLVAYLLDRAGVKPGFLIGGLAMDFDESCRAAPPGGCFVVEGDEYDSAFFEKSPKFWQYQPHGAILTSVEYDHVDIYPSESAYQDAFRGFVARIADDGVLVAHAGDPRVRALAEVARCRVVRYGLEGDDHGSRAPSWLAAPGAAGETHQSFDLYASGSYCGRFQSALVGRHNILNATAAIALVAELSLASTRQLGTLLTGFRGVRRRQQLLGLAGGVRVYDDFAHHPTAVRATLEALRQRHRHGSLIAVFEPRTATASRRLHQGAYATAFAAADIALLAPVGRPEIAEGERLDVAAIAEQIHRSGRHAEAPPDLGELLTRIDELARPGDTVVLMSNGPFGAIHDKLLARLATRRLPPTQNP